MDLRYRLWKLKYETGLNAQTVFAKAKALRRALYLKYFSRKADFWRTEYGTLQIIRRRPVDRWHGFYFRELTKEVEADLMQRYQLVKQNGTCEEYELKPEAES